MQVSPKQRTERSGETMEKKYNSTKDLTRPHFTPAPVFKNSQAVVDDRLIQLKQMSEI